MSAVSHADPLFDPALHPLLDVSDVSIAFGGLKAVQHFSITVPTGGLYGLIGPNGAGKTTAFNLLTGVYQPDSGNGHDRRSSHRWKETASDRGRRIGAHISEYPAVWRALRARQRSHRLPAATPARHVRDDVSHRRIHGG